MFSSFRTCKQVQHVSDMAIGIHKKPEFKNFPAKAAVTQKKLTQVRDKRTNNTKLLQKARDGIKSSFKDLRKKIVQLVDNMEKRSLDEMERLLTSLESKVEADTSCCSQSLDKIQNMLTQMQKLGKDCETFAFECMKKCQEETIKAETLLVEIIEEDYQIKFIPDLQIEKYLSSLELLGTFCVTPYLPTTKNSIKVPEDHIYTIEKKQAYNLRTVEDDESCVITGVCQLPDGNIAVTDWPNSKVKLLNSSTFSVLAQLNMPPNPCDICHTTGLQLAVALYEMSDGKFKRNEIHIVRAQNGGLSRERTIKLSHGCAGINYQAGKLYVSFRDALYTYNMSGQNLQKLYEDRSSDAFVFRFCMSDDGNRIYMTSMIKEILLTLDNTGRQLSSLNHPDLKNPTGICMADNGTVFVCGFQTNSILQVDASGKKKMATVASETDGVNDPKSLYYNRQKQQLLVGLHDDNLLVLKLK